MGKKPADEERIAQERSSFEDDSRDEPSDFEPCEEVELLAGADQLGDYEELNDEQDDENEQAVAQPFRDD